MEPLLLQKADFDQGTEELPNQRDPTPPPFHIPQQVRGDDDECLLRDLSNNQTNEPEPKSEQMRKKPANRRKRKKGATKPNNATTATTTTKSWTLYNVIFILFL